MMHSAQVKNPSDYGYTALAIYLVSLKPSYEQALNDAGIKRGLTEIRIAMPNCNPPKLDERQARIVAFLRYKWGWRYVRITPLFNDCSEACLIRTLKRHGLFKRGVINNKWEVNI